MLAMPNPPIPTPAPCRVNSIPILIHCLRVVVSLQCFGIAEKYLLPSNETESDVFEWLLFDFGWPESVVQVIDDVAAFGCLLSGIWLLMPVVVALLSQAKKGTGPNLVDANFPSGSLGLDRMFKFTEVGSLLAVSIWVCLMATATSIRGGIYSELMFGEVAVGIIAPVVLILLLCWRLEPTKALWLLRVSAATTFAIHGYKAVMHYGPFVDLILLSDLRITGFEPSQTAIEKILAVIGWVDIGLAVTVMFSRLRLVAGYMFFWGAITAVSRITAFGWQAWPETLIRTANWGVPLIILVGFIICDNRLSKSK